MMYALDFVLIHMDCSTVLFLMFIHKVKSVLEPIRYEPPRHSLSRFPCCMKKKEYNYSPQVEMLVHSLNV